MSRHQALQFLGYATGVAILAGSSSVAAFAQRDRTGPDRSRAVVTGRETTEKPQSKLPEDADSAARSETAKYGNASKMVIRGDLAKGISKDDYEKAFSQSKSDYAIFLKRFTRGEPYSQAHVKLRFAEFAPAYFLVLYTEVARKISNGLELAEKRAQLISYERILTRDVGLDKDKANSMVKEAREVLASFK